MSIYIIARINASRDITRTIGYRLYNTDHRLVKDVYTQDLISYMREGTIIENAVFDEQGLHGVGGRLERYPAVNESGALLTKSAVTIIQMAKDEFYNGYVVVNYLGRDTYAKEDELIAYGFRNGIANGKLVTTNGKTKIVPIDGKYTTGEVDPSEQGLEVTDRRLYTPTYKLPSYSNKCMDKVASYFKVSRSIKRKSYKIELYYINNYAQRPYKLTLADEKYADDIIRKYYIEVLPCDEVYYETFGKAIITVNELVYHSGKKFLVQCAPKKPEAVLLDDIIYVGGRLLKGSDKNSKPSGDSKIILGLGQLNLAILELKDDVNSNYEYISYIPYYKLNSIDVIDRLLIKLNINPSEVSNNAKTEILFRSKSPRIPINEVTNPYGLKAMSVYNRSLMRENKFVAENSALKSAISLDLTEIIQGGTWRAVDSPKVPDELAREFTTYGKDRVHIFQFDTDNYIITSLVNNIDNKRYGIKTKETDETIEAVLDPSEIIARYIGYAGLYKNKLIPNIVKDWYSGDCGDLILKHIWYIDITDNTLTICISSIKLVFDIPSLLELYNKDIEKYNAIEKKANRFRLKSKVIGAGIDINSLGHIVNWETSTEVEHKEAILGLEVTDENANSPLLTCRIHKGFELIDRRRHQYCHVTNVMIIADKDTLGIAFKYNISKAFISLKNVETVNELDRIVSSLLKSGCTEVISVNGKKVRLDVLDKYTTGFMVMNASSIYTIKDKYNPLKQLSRDCIEQLDLNDDVRTQFVRNLLGVIPNKRATKRIIVSSMVMHKIFELIYPRDDAMKLKNEYNNWILKTRGIQLDI